MFINAELVERGKKNIEIIQFSNTTEKEFKAWCQKNSYWICGFSKWKDENEYRNRGEINGK